MKKIESTSIKQDYYPGDNILDYLNKNKSNGYIVESDVKFDQTLFDSISPIPYNIFIKNNMMISGGFALKLYMHLIGRKKWIYGEWMDIDINIIKDTDLTHSEFRAVLPDLDIKNIKYFVSGNISFTMYYNKSNIALQFLRNVIKPNKIWYQLDAYDITACKIAIFQGKFYISPQFSIDKLYYYDIWSSESYRVSKYLKKLNLKHNDIIQIPYFSKLHVDSVDNIDLPKYKQYGSGLLNHSDFSDESGIIKNILSRGCTDSILYKNHYILNNMKNINYYYVNFKHDNKFKLERRGIYWNEFIKQYEIKQFKFIQISYGEYKKKYITQYKYYIALKNTFYGTVFLFKNLNDIISFKNKNPTLNSLYEIISPHNMKLYYDIDGTILSASDVNSMRSAINDFIDMMKKKNISCDGYCEYINFDKYSAHLIFDIRCKDVEKLKDNAKYYISSFEHDVDSTNKNIMINAIDWRVYTKFRLFRLPYSIKYSVEDKLIPVFGYEKYIKYIISYHEPEPNKK